MGRTGAQGSHFYAKPMTMNWIRRHKIEIIIFALALVARLVFFSMVFAHNSHELLPTIHGDDGYYEISQGIMNGHGFTWDTMAPWKPNPLRPPVWPFLIAFWVKIFGSYWAVFAFEMILGSLIPVLAFHVSLKIFGERVGKWVGTALCFEPYSVLFSFLLYSETCFIFFFLLFALFLLRYFQDKTIRNLVWMSVFMGLATLVKPTIQYVPIILAALMPWDSRKNVTKKILRDIAIMLALFAVVVAPWVYRNYREFGVIGMSAQPAFNLYVYLMPTVLAIDEHSTFDAEQKKTVLINGFSSTDTITLATSGIYSGKALSVIKEHKVALVKSGLISLVTFFTHDGMLTVLGNLGIRIPNILNGSALSLIAHPRELTSAVIHYAASPAVIILIMRLVWIVITLFFLWGVYAHFKKEGVTTIALSALILVLYFAATTAINGFGVNARFRMPVEVFILGFAAYGFFNAKLKRL